MVLLEPSRLAVTQGEDVHYISINRAPSRFHAGAVLDERDHLVALGDELIRLEVLDLFSRIKRREELCYLLAPPALSSHRNNVRWTGRGPLHIIGE